MCKYETKAIQTDLGTFRHSQTYPGIIQAYSKLSVTLTYLKLLYIQNPDIFRTISMLRTLAYSQTWYIQNAGIFRTLAYSKSEAYSEPCQTSTMKRFARIVNGYKCFHKLNVIAK